MKRIGLSFDEDEFLILQSAARARGLKMATFIYTVLFRDYIHPVQEETKTETVNLFSKKKGGKK